MADLSSTRVFGKLTVMHDAILKANAQVAGTVTAGSFSGNGSSLTALNASNLSSGTVPDARLPTTAIRWPAFNEVTGKPSSYPATSHTHTWGEVTGQPATATRWPSFSEVTGKPSTYAPSTHSHPISGVTGLQDSLNSKRDANNTAFPRYDLASAVTTATLDLAQQQVFRVDASTARTLSFVNAPGANRAMTVIIHITGNSTVTWPTEIEWDEGAAPELGSVFTRVILIWDGLGWTGNAGGSR